MTRAPVIGITLDCEEPARYVLRRNYVEAVARAGGLPVLLPHEPEQVPAYLGLVDGLVVTGGAFDIDPALFGAAERHPAVTLKPGRTDFELALLRGALDAGLPVLGICGGQQLLNVALGGTLIQHIPDEVDGALAHEQPNPRNEPGHEVAVVAGSKLAAIVGVPRLAVNSSHHQAVKAVAPGCLADAIAPDGVVEGIEDPSRRFCIGVQWHPEYAITPADTALFTAFITACK